MTLSDQPDDLYEEVKLAIQQTFDHIEPFETLIGRFTGPWWKQATLAAGAEGRSGEYAPENAYYEYISLVVPRLIFDNPRMMVGTRRKGPQEKVAEAVRHGLNRWVRDIDLRRRLVRHATDMMFNFSIAVTTEEPRKGVELPTWITEGTELTIPTWPMTERLAQKHYFQDPGALHVDALRFRGHEYRRDKSDILKEAREFPELGWNVKAVEDLATDTYADSEERYQNKTPYREEVRAYEMWVPEHELDDSPGEEEGFHGTLYTLGVSQASSYGSEGNAKFLRDPRPFYGPAWGPYTMFGAYYVPNSAMPLAPLTACNAQINDLNDQVLAASISMQKHKRILGCPTERAARIVKDTYHDFVVVIPFDDEGHPLVQEYVLGGMTAEQIEWIQHTRDRTDRILGIDDALRGTVTGQGTATEHQIANESATARLAFIKANFTDAVVQIQKTAAYYMYHSDEVIFPLDDAAAQSEMFGDVKEPWFIGGDEDPESGYSFDDLELEIEPYSMERANEGLNQKRALETHELLLNALPLMAQFPSYPWKAHFDKIGSAMNMPDLGALFPEEMLQQMAGDLAMSEQATPKEGPRFGRQGRGVSGGGGGGGGAQFVGGMPGNLSGGAVAPAAVA